ncbi:hypothetical protein MRB53_021176 [Persea americana]|uniref:Uncharacterized protein n=1 Tax=Persea americana TaxID=3435 RepID=A0ACC2L4A3_PERAE|nr:hypothetical protein MRB53_021176 [Persea americana]
MLMLLSFDLPLTPASMAELQLLINGWSNGHCPKSTVAASDSDSRKMALGSHDDEFDPEIRNEINVEEDEIDESYAPDKDDDFVEYNYDGMELEDENWEFEKTLYQDPKGSDSDGISYHRYHEFDPNMQMDQPALSIGLSFKDVNMLRMVLRQYAV